MSHSKMTGRGRSQYVEGWNPAAKKFINVCVLCGARGYSPTIDEEGFTGDGKADYVHHAIRAELSSILKPLALDGLGRCESCAKIMDKNTARVEDIQK